MEPADGDTWTVSGSWNAGRTGACGKSRNFVPDVSNLLSSVTIIVPENCRTGPIRPLDNTFPDEDQNLSVTSSEDTKAYSRKSACIKIFRFVKPADFAKASTSFGIGLPRKSRALRGSPDRCRGRAWPTFCRRIWSAIARPYLCGRGRGPVRGG